MERKYILFHTGRGCLMGLHVLLVFILAEAAVLVVFPILWLALVLAMAVGVPLLFVVFWWDWKKGTREI